MIFQLSLSSSGPKTKEVDQKAQSSCCALCWTSGTQTTAPCRGPRDLGCRGYGTALTAGLGPPGAHRPHPGLLAPLLEEGPGAAKRLAHDRHARRLGPGAGLSGPKEPPFHFLPADSCPNLESYLTPSSLSPATSHRILLSAPPRNRPPRACPLRRCPRLGDHGAPFGDSHRLLGLAAVGPAAAPARTLLNDYPTRLQ